jgi:prepilin-type N-terminal cleavage/methylation domain-containing protein
MLSGLHGHPRIMNRTRAFTLIELLTVIAIIAVLAVITSVVAGSFVKTANMANAMNNMRQLGAGFMTYTASHDGELPLLGDQNPGFGSGGSGEEVDAWYNAVPKLAGGRAISDYGGSGAKDFFKKSNPLYVPGAKYPPNPNRPLFAIAMNSKLHPPGSESSSVRMANMIVPARTIIFLETGLPDEKPLPGQSAGDYRGDTRGEPGNIAARYNRPSEKADVETLLGAGTNLLFGDGHGESLPVSQVITTSGQAHYPQLGQDGGRGKVCWTLDPEARP